MSIEAKKGIYTEKEQILQAIAIKSPDETWQDFSKRTEVPVRTVHRYRNVYAERIKAISDEEFKKDIPVWKRSLSDQAKKGDVGALRLALEMVGEYTPRSEVKGDQTVRFRELKDLTKEEIEKLLKEMLPEGITLLP